MSKKAIDVYFSVQDGFNIDKNWNLLYEDPTPIYKDISLNMNNQNTQSFFKCPAFRSASKNTFIIKNPIRSHISITYDGAFSIGNSSMLFETANPPSIKEEILIKYGLIFYFFSEESVNMKITSPYFHRSKYLQYGSVVPGEFDISQWFRPLHPEINIWKNVNELIIEKDEPLFYLSFDTKKTINLKRFTMNDTLYRIAQTCATSPSWEPLIPITERYKRFIRSKTNKIVMREIKRNLI